MKPTPLMIYTIGIMMLGGSVVGLVYEMGYQDLSATEFIDRCDEQYGYTAWHVEKYPTRSGIVNQCVPNLNNIEPVPTYVMDINYSVVRR